MLFKSRHIISVFLVILLMAPGFIKLEHHHDHFVCKAKNEKHFHVFHEKCQICSFEFSAYSLQNFSGFTILTGFLAEIRIPLYHAFFSSASGFIFLLRAPPVVSSTI